MKLSELKKHLAYLSIIFCSAIISVLFSWTYPGQELEFNTIDYRFLLISEKSLSDKIALVLMDESSRKKFGEAPYSREIFATLIKGLNKMGARIIGVDFCFEDRKLNKSDSLLCAEVQRANNVITGCYFRSIFSNLNREDRYALNHEILKSFPFLQADEEAPVFHELLQTNVRIGHVNFLINDFTGHVYSIPLYVTYKDSLFAAFSLQVIKFYYGISDQQIKIDNGELVLMPGGRETIRIPINKSGEYLINYFGYEQAFQNYYSLIDVYNHCQKIIENEISNTISKNLKDKIVLIGTIIDEDNVATPFSVVTPGILIHATVVDNILQKHFIKQYQHLNTLIFLMLGITSLLIFAYSKPLVQVVGSSLLALGFILGVYLLFKFFLILVPLISSLLFIVLSATVLGMYKYAAALKLNASLNSRVQQLDKMVKLLDARGKIISPATSYYRFIIFNIKEKNMCIFPHWLELRNFSQHHEFPFQPKLPVKNPIHVNLNFLKKLSFDLQKIWELYFKFIQTGKTDTIKPLIQLKKISSTIVSSLGLKGTFNKLFNFYDKRFPLNMIIMDYNIPWHLAYHAGNDRFLCEDYAIGISFASEQNFYNNNLLAVTNNNRLLPENKAALLFYGDWARYPFKKLHHVHKQITGLAQKLNRNGYSVKIIKEKEQDFLFYLEHVVSVPINLRLIHYSGHAEEGCLDPGENNFLKPGMITENLGITLPSQPLVFLNACSSGKLPPNWNKIDNLATEFLACGAAACIVTCFDVFEKTAIFFSNRFYEYFIDQKLEAGNALKLTIKDLAQVDKKNGYNPVYDITRYAYCLYGDPTVKF